MPKDLPGLPLVDGVGGDEGFLSQALSAPMHSTATEKQAARRN